MNARMLPLLGFVLLIALLGFGIGYMRNNSMNDVPSPLIDKAAPAFNLPVLGQPERMVSKDELWGQPGLLNVVASWCFACVEEHPVWMSEAKRLGVRVAGFNYKDDSDDAKRWLAKFGDPYDLVIVDRDGRVAIDFGVYGAPETFLVDAQGVIRHKHIGPITPLVISRDLQPRIDALAKGAP